MNFLPKAHTAAALSILPLIFMLCCARGFAQDSRRDAPREDPVSAEVALRAIALFRTEPGSDTGRGAVSVVMSFAEKSPDVKVEMNMTLLPWMDEAGMADKYKGLLMGAFVVGDVRSQLDAHVKKSDPLAGVLQVIETYLALKKQDPALVSPGVEKWIALQKDGRLKELLPKK